MGIAEAVGLLHSTTMSARALLALVFGARVLACEPMPDLTFVEDAGTEDGAPSALLYDATSTEGSAQTTPDANGDAPSSTADSAPICPPSGAPVGTQCCPGGTVTLVLVTRAALPCAFSPVGII